VSDSDTERKRPPNTTDRENTASFDEWYFETGLPDEDALQRMCRNAAKTAVEDLVKDIWLLLHFSDDRNASCPQRFEFCLHAWDGDVTLGRPFAEVVREFADGHAFNDGGIADDNEEMLQVIAELEAAAAMIRGRMRPRRSP
jgi:hypothetical protein